MGKYWFADTVRSRMNEYARKLLIVEDDAGLLHDYRQCFDGYDVYAAADREQAVAELRRHEPAVVLLDLHLPPRRDDMEGGLAALAELLKLAPHTKIIVLIDNVDQEMALSAVAQGAYNFYKKPIDPDILRLIVNRAFAIYELEAENRRLQNQVAATGPFGLE